MTALNKILAINGSHRSEKGFTQIVLKSFLNGARSADAQCEILYPSKQNIAACQSCGKCLFETPGVCKYDDDVKTILDKMEQADLVVFASPVYFDCMPSNLKKMIERFRSTLDAYFEYRNGRTYHLKIDQKRQKVILIFTAGNPERDSFTSISNVFNRIIDNMNWQLLGEFQFPASHLLDTKPQALARQLEALTQSGRSIVLNGRISNYLLSKANQEYIHSPEAILKGMTETVLKIRKTNQADSALI